MADLELPFLKKVGEGDKRFPGIFIRAPVVEKILQQVEGEQLSETLQDEMVIAPARDPRNAAAREVEIMATLPGRGQKLKGKIAAAELSDEFGDIVAVRQENVFGTSFHPELTGDVRIHVWWLGQVMDALLNARSTEAKTT